MKKLLILLLPLFFLGLAWEGDLNPEDFENWEVVKIVEQTQNFIYLITKNPSETSNIKFVFLAYTIKGQLVEYYYFKNNKPYIFLYFENIDKFKKLPDWKTKKCLECHEQKRNRQNLI